MKLQIPKVPQGQHYDGQYAVVGNTPYGRIFVQNGTFLNVETNHTDVIDDYTPQPEQQYRTLWTGDDKELDDDALFFRGDFAPTQYTTVTGKEWVLYDMWKFHLITNPLLTPQDAALIEKSVYSRVDRAQDVELRSYLFDRMKKEISQLHITVQSLSRTNSPSYQHPRKGDFWEDERNLRDFFYDAKSRVARPHVYLFSDGQSDICNTAIFASMLDVVGTYFRNKGWKLPHSGDACVETYQLTPMSALDRKIWDMKSAQGKAELKEIGGNLRWQLL